MQINSLRFPKMQIIKVNSPIIFTEKSAGQLADFQPGIIYSIRLDNGMIITSPEGFEPLSIQQAQQRVIEVSAEA
jgi:hypothetical protein